MAEKRMITRKVTDDDRFVNLSASAQALYLHLNMSADDDGFNNQVSVAMFRAHASVQDLEALLSARYLIQFDSGVIVIKHWRMANALRKDRYTPTAFQEEFSKLNLKENGAYTEAKQERSLDGCRLVAGWVPDVCHRVDKDSVDKDSVEEGGRAREALGEVMSFYLDRINATPSTMVVAEIESFVSVLSAPVVLHAMQIAVDEGKYAWSYILAILARYQREDLKTLEKVQRSEQEHAQRKKPTGGKVQASNEPSRPATQKDLDKILNSI